MQFAIDTHVHIYPFYRVEQALESVIENLSRAGENAVKIGCLTERYDCDIYNELATAPRPQVAERFHIENRENFLFVRRRQGIGKFYLLPGQQIITKENIEVLSLNCLKRVTEGNSAVDTVHDILTLGGLPVVAWAPGKWFFKRGEVVQSLIEQFNPSELALGDTTLRPLGWGVPSIMRTARRRGFKILYGSDPLPFNGEETTPGSYATLIQNIKHSNNSDTPDPGKLLSNVLSEDLQIQSVGSRGTFPRVLKRLYQNNRAPKPSRDARITTNA